MIITKLIGGLGNQMFQYAAAKSLAVKWDTSVFVDIKGFENQSDDTPRKYELSIFETPIPIADTKSIQLLKKEPENIWQKWMQAFKLNPKANSIAFESSHAYNIIFDTLTDNTYLNGFWQSELYFESIAATIRNDFKIKSIYLTNLDMWFTKIKRCNSASIHIRRGDYASNHAANAFHGLCSLAYYEKGVEYINSKQDNIELFIFSDDIEWCRMNFRFSNTMHFVIDTTAYQDLHLMSQCQHHIIANSSFSWWGAWLNHNTNKIVVAPEKWFANTAIDTKDIIPKSWIKL